MSDVVDEAISQAKQAAAQAGFGAAVELEESTHKTSYAFELEGLDEAPVIPDIEAALHALPGVRARVVYSTKSAWITAPEGLPPQRIVEVFATFGVRAVMTDSSLRRRSMLRGESADALPKSYANRKARRHAEEEAQSLEQARRSGFFASSGRQPQWRPEGGAVDPATGQTVDRDVLYTARDLITTPRLFMAVVLTVPVLALSYRESWQFAGWQWLVAALTLPVVTWCAFPFHRAMAGGVRRGAVALDGASSIAIVLAFVWSVGALCVTEAGTIGWRGTPHLLAAYDPGRGDATELFFDVACGVTALLLCGRKLSIQSRSSLLEELAAQHVDPQEQITVVRRNRATGEVTKEVTTIGEINVGDDVLVEPGQLIPVDGVVVGGHSTVRPSVIAAASTGKAATFEVDVDDRVAAGSFNVTHRLKIRVHRTGHRTRMAGVERWIAAVNRHQNDAVMLSTRTASTLIPVAFVLAAGGFALWALATNNLALALSSALAVLASVAPAALALSSALALRLGIETAARGGMLLRAGEVMRGLQMVDTVVFNRVGTLAEPDMVVETVTADRGENPELVLRVAGALCLESDHPASQAIVHAARQARDQGSGGDDIPNWIEVSHLGIDADGAFVATIDMEVTDAQGQTHSRLIPAKLWRPRNLSELDGQLAAAAIAGGTPLVVAWNGKDRGVITLHDSVKDDAARAVRELGEMGLETMMLTRDTYPVGRRFADRIGIDRVLAGIAPGRKEYTIRAVHTRGARVAMVGDSSVTQCLEVADVGLLISDEISFEHVSRGRHRGIDVVVLRHDVKAVPQLIRLARTVCSVIDRNILFAWAYNGLAVVASLAGLLHPMVATVLMLASSLVIEARSNSVRKALR
ncbi:heavy metal translocating P-type ATPase [Corynebacterium uberis]|uniref:heavy metal translocating P-type ATPase n=1 Tax=Corynebacterium uberis TaxID=2883169 RepID=UPI001D0BB289|nr:HAD family hydrolase [Corynebacterium uberis]UDL73061.1 HAD family hydrolase [Corynebacterium uberis]